MQKPKFSLDHLRLCIAQHAAAQVADSWSGGGDPLDVPVLEAEAKAAAARLEAELKKPERELTDVL
jgi:hypothetical protein